MPGLRYLITTLSALCYFAGCAQELDEWVDPEGAEGGACYQNGTCDEGLICLSDICVIPDDAPQNPTDAGAAEGSTEGTPVVDSGSADGSIEGSASEDAGAIEGNIDGTTTSDAGSSDGSSDGTVTTDAGATNGSSEGGEIIDSGYDAFTDGGNLLLDAGGTENPASADAGTSITPECEQDIHCDDGLYCTGNEYCTQSLTCANSGPPCSDELCVEEGDYCIVTDCNDVPEGDAYTDNCDVCVGGNTGLTGCTQDCNNEWGGSAALDDCSTCVGGSTGLDACEQDCLGQWGGSATAADCEASDGGVTETTDAGQAAEAVSCSSLSFDGQNDYVQIPDAEALRLASGSYTVEAWVNAADISTPTSNAIISKRDAFNSGWLAQIVGTNPGYEELLSQIAFNLDVGGSWIASSSIVNQSIWHHLAFNYEQTTGIMSLYIDGVAGYSGTLEQPVGSSAKDLFIGKDPGTSSYFFNGAIDTIRISSVARYASNFTPQLHFEADENTIGLWDFTAVTDENTLVDLSGNEHDGAISGASFSVVCPADTAGAQCGDNIQAPWEQCDDGNIVDGDGCSATCELEEGLFCYETDQCVYQDATSGTPLMWQGCPAGQTGTDCSGGALAKDNRQASITYCENLSWGGFDDWVLPNIDELRSLMRGCPDNEYGSGNCSITHQCSFSGNNDCTEATCSGCSDNGGPRNDGSYLPADLPGASFFYIWTSSLASATLGFTIYFINGDVTDSALLDSFGMRCVRTSD